MKSLRLPVYLLTLLLLCGCKDDARAIWKDGVKKCAQNDLLGPHVLFFGPSNRHGPGTVFEKFADGGIQVSHLASEYLTNVTGVIADGEAFTCSATKESEAKVSASLDLSKVLSAPASVSGEFKSAKSIQVKSDSLQWVELVTGPFKQSVTHMPDDSQVKVDLLSPNHFVLSRALKVHGMSAELDFSKEAAAAAKATLPATVSGLAGTGITFDLAWTNDTKLVVTSKGDFFIGGELRRYQQGGLAQATVGELVQEAAKLKFKGF